MKPLKPVIIADSHIPFLRGALEPFASVHYAEGGDISRNQALGADGLIIRTRTRCDEALLKGTPVRFIASATIGHDHIDTGWCEANGISWHHAPGCNASAVQQYIASAMARLVTGFHYRLQGKTIGIVGVGHTGKLVAGLSEVLGMKPLLNDPPLAIKEGARGFVDLEGICSEADIITLHVPLEIEGPFPTHHMAGRDFFRKLKRKPILINTSRGPVIDTRATVSAIREGQITAFIGDVWEDEPEIHQDLLNISHIATPHIAGYSAEGKANGTTACVRAASRHFGFGIDHWRLASLPLPENPVISIDPGSTWEERLIGEAILAAYNIMKDDEALRKNPQTFESLRNHYPNRREFSAFTVMAGNIPGETARKLESLGFNTA